MVIMMTLATRNDNYKATTISVITRHPLSFRPGQISPTNGSSMDLEWPSFSSTKETHKQETDQERSSFSPVTSSLKKSKKKPQPIPEEFKDNAYWERRKKNNESAKRSRELRRCKEEQTKYKVALLEQENLQLKAEVAMLRKELEKVHNMLYSRLPVTDNS
ncbi:hepatic leukemia factor-like isoform X2 [Tachypleus tridentatus]|uniref:hepatic leukemia factor-like isoform X2 n=1 Tax=Tachypleus tridentatus TaxID=6853 RepID=UPI003FD56C5D